jgi:hypothetical protein
MREQYDGNMRVMMSEDGELPIVSRHGGVRSSQQERQRKRTMGEGGGGQ